MTERLYYKYPYQFEFTANVVSTNVEDNIYTLILNKTCFYPAGGGQPADAGWINNIKVLDVQSKGNDIIHYLEKKPDTTEVFGKIDRDRRLDFMQQHTGQHILSQSLLQIGNFHTVSVHLGDAYTSVELDTAEIRDQDLSEAEMLANRIINQNLPIKVCWVDPVDVPKFHLRRPPPDVEKVRIVEIDGFDFSSCGGIHVSSTGEVGFIKIIAKERIRGRVRLLAKIGKRALLDYGKKITLVRDLNRMLTCGEGDIVSSVVDLQEQVKTINRELTRTQSELMLHLAEKALADAKQIDDVDFIAQTFENINNKTMKIFVDSLLTGNKKCVLAMSQNSDQVNWIAGHSAGNKLKLNEIVKPLLPIIDGRGGGRANLIQGGGNYPAGIPRFILEFEKKLIKELTENE